MACKPQCDISPNPQIRPMASGDLVAIVDILVSCYQHLAIRDNYADSELQALINTICTPESVLRRFPDYDVFIAESNGRAAGYIAIEWSDVAELFVHPSCQRQGIGSALFFHIEKLLRNAGHPHITVWTASAPAFYQKLGARIVEQTVCAGGPLKGHALFHLQKDL